MDLAQSFFDVGELVVGTLLASEVNPTAHEWDFALEELRGYLKRREVTIDHVRLLVVTQGGSPDARQRAQLKSAFEGRQPKVAVISAALDNPLKRGIATAIQWINPRVALFAPEQARAALAYLQIERAAAQVLVEYAALERRVRKLPVLQAVALALAATTAAASSNP